MAPPNTSKKAKQKAKYNERKMRLDAIVAKVNANNGDSSILNEEEKKDYFTIQKEKQRKQEYSSEINNENGYRKNKKRERDKVASKKYRDQQKKQKLEIANVVDKVKAELDKANIDLAKAKADLAKTKADLEKAKADLAKATSSKPTFIENPIEGAHTSSKNSNKKDNTPRKSINKLSNQNLTSKRRSGRLRSKNKEQNANTIISLLDDQSPDVSNPNTGHCCWSFDATSRVLLAKFQVKEGGNVIVTNEDKLHLLNMMERTDISVISENLGEFYCQILYQNHLNYL